MQFVGNPRKAIRRVAIVTGAGGEIARTLSPEHADVFLTGEIDHHDATEARENGLNVIAIGHFESEVLVVPVLGSWLRRQAPVADAKIRVIEARPESSPFRSL